MAGIVSATLIIAGVSCLAGMMGTVDIHEKFQGIQEGVHRQLIVIRHHFDNTAIVIPSQTTTTTTRLDCTLSSTVPGGQLSKEEEAWCCEKVGMHCPTTVSTTTTPEATQATEATTEAATSTAEVSTTTVAATTLTSTSTTRGLFDCRLGDPNFWPSSKRTWCCREEGFACENGCEAPCRHGGVKHTCANSVVQAATGRYHGRKDAPSLAYTLTLETCPHCAACALVDVPFPAEPSTSKIAAAQSSVATSSSAMPIAWAVVSHSDRATEPPVPVATVSPSQKACGQVCDFGGKEETCGARVRVAASIAMSQTKINVCFAAYRHVLQRCPFCSSCSLADTGCNEIYTITRGQPSAAAAKETASEESTLKKAYHCEDLPVEGQDIASWSAGKATWCCEQEQIGCASSQVIVVPKTTSHLRKAKRAPYSCLVLPSHPMKEWSEGEKMWCCTNKQIGCVPTLAPPRLK